jgi:DNA-binding NtrC family response regulator
MSELNAKILIIEDEDAIRESLQAILATKGFDVASSATGKDALDKIKRDFYDILLVDYKLNDMDGLNLIKESLFISKDSVPIIITGYSSVETAVDAMRIGAHDYLIKPVDIDSLIETIKVILNERDELRRGQTNLQRVITSKLLPLNDGEIIVVGGKAKDILVRRVSGVKKLLFFPVTIAKALKKFYLG